ncbi:MAG: HEAT repeat domain-containing protein [Pirellulales bacterium]|nr:HEAT repeat domain-containing protein [Pirellulales bacterium]
MTLLRRWIIALSSCLLVPLGNMAAHSVDVSNEEATKLVVELLLEKDEDLRALALEQVRTAIPGADATRQVAAQLPKLKQEGQVALLRALADRGDSAALADVVKLSGDGHAELVRAAAIAAIGKLGGAAELSLLLSRLSAAAPTERESARTALLQLRGETVPEAIAKEIKQVSPPVKRCLIEILADRRALAIVDDILPAALDSDPEVRKAAMSALGEMASAEQIFGMLQAVLMTEKGTERRAAERSVAAVCGRIKDLDERAGAILTPWAKFDEASRNELLAVLGRVGGVKVYAVVKSGLASADEATREAALQAICNWPDDSVAEELMELAQNANDARRRALAFQALVRVGAIRDQRTDAQRLERMKQALSIAKTDAERALVVHRCRTTYSLDALRFVTPYLEQPMFRQVACETIVELAHHRELREPNKKEFDAALDRVIELSGDPVVVERASRYKRGETWNRKQAGDAARESSG